MISKAFSGSTAGLEPPFVSYSVLLIRISASFLIAIENTAAPFPGNCRIPHKNKKFGNLSNESFRIFIKPFIHKKIFLLYICHVVPCAFSLSAFHGSFSGLALYLFQQKPSFFYPVQDVFVFCIIIPVNCIGHLLKLCF